MAVIKTNISAQYAQDALAANQKSMNTAMQQLATGNRINSAKVNHAARSVNSISKYLVESAFILLCNKIPVVVISDGVQIVLRNPVFVFL